MSCLPGMPCFGNNPNNPSPINCGVDQCFTYKTTTDLTHYVGPNLPCIDVNTCETLTTVIEKIDYALCGDNLATVFINTLITNTTLYNLFCSQVIRNCITCDYMKDCIDCDYINGCIPPCPTTTTTSTSTTAIPCFCNEATVASGTIYQINWQDCDGSDESLTITNETFRMCARKQSVTFFRVSGTGNFTFTGGVDPCTQSSDCYEQFRIDVEDIDTFLIERIDFLASRPIIIDWGDGTTTTLSSSPAFSVSHTYDPLIYPAGYTGQIIIKATDLTKITRLHLNDVFGTNVPPTGKFALVTGSEISKLDGVTTLQMRFATLNCTTSQLPRSITSLTSILGNISGDVANLPTNIQSINLGNYGLGGIIYFNSNTINGLVTNFRSTLRSISIYGQNTLDGNINTINSSVRNLCTSFNIGGDNTITGDITSTFNANTVMISFSVFGYNTIFGNLDGNGIVPAFPSTVMTTFQLSGLSYPSGTTLGAFGHMSVLKTLVMEFDEAVLPWPTNIGTSLTGDVADLPSTINFCLIAGANTVSGDVADIPSGVYVGQTSYINIRGTATGSNPTGGNTISGLVDDIPTNCRFFTVTGKNTIDGDIANIPAVTDLTTIRIGSNTQTVFGNLWNLPAQIKVFEITNGLGVITYTPPVPYPSLTVSKTWATGLNRLWIKNPAVTLPLNDMDQLLIDVANVTWATSSSFPSKEFWVYGVPPNFHNLISTPAEISLIAQGVTIQYT